MLSYSYVNGSYWYDLYSREDEYLVNMQHTVIPSWYQRDGYIKAMGDLIEKELKKFNLPKEVSFSYFMPQAVKLSCADLYIQSTFCIKPLIDYFSE